MNAALFPDLVVNGERIPSAVIAAEAQHHAAPRDKPGLAWRKAANAIAMRTLLLQEAARCGLQPQPDQVGPNRRETEDESLIRALLEQAVTVDPPSEDAIRAEWLRDPTRFRAPPLWEVSHILIACDPGDPADREAAKALLVEAQSRPAGFAGLARGHSACGSKSRGGALGQVAPGDTEPPFEAALRNLAEGEVAPEPALTRHGWHVIRMDAAAEGAILPFDAVRPKIAEAMEKADWALAARVFVTGLIAASEISGADLGPV
jgi:peptidyl-prolyl cis-trans isomerase C